MATIFLNQTVKLKKPVGDAPAGARGGVIRDRQNGTYLVYFDFNRYPATECCEDLLEVYRPKRLAGFFGFY